MKRWVTVSSVLIVLCLAVVFIATATAETASQTYSINCANCHNANGDGRTNYSKRVPTPDLRSKYIQDKTDAQLYDVIGKGAEHVNYPHSFEARGMAPDKIRGLVAFIRTLKKDK